MAGSTRAVETAARKERLVAAARELAAAGGYDAVQMRDVAARADVALGTLYRHYAGKDQLLIAALTAQAVALREQLALRPPRGASPADRVGDVLRRATRALERERRLTGAMVTALSSPESSAAAAKLEVNQVLRSILAVAIDGVEVAGLDAVLRALGYVWLSVLTAWVGGLIDGAQMAADLESAARLMLR